MSRSVDPAPQQTGVRNRAEHSETIHRQDPDADDPCPACTERGRDAEFKTAHIPSLLPFSRWSLCQNDACFGGDDEGNEGDLDRGEGLEADGGREVEHYLDNAADQLETALSKADNEWDRKAIGALRRDLAGLQGFELPEEDA